MYKERTWYFQLLFWSVLGCYACGSTPTEEVFSVEEINTEVETTYDVELIYSDSAIVSVLVTSPKMLTNSKRGENKQVFPEGIDVDFFAPNGSIQSELTCKKATRYERDKKIVMQDSVVWKSGKGEILDTEELIWDEGDQKIYSKRLVRIVTDQDIIHGYGFEADQGFTKWKITRPQGEMGVKDIE